MALWRKCKSGDMIEVQSPQGIMKIEIRSVSELHSRVQLRIVADRPGDDIYLWLFQLLSDRQALHWPEHELKVELSPRAFTSWQNGGPLIDGSFNLKIDAGPETNITHHQGRSWKYETR